MSVKTKPQARLRRRRRVRAKVRGTAARPRLSVFRSNRGVQAQLVDDTVGRTVVAATSPTACFEIPRTTIRVGCGTSKSMPSGASSSTGCE